MTADVAIRSYLLHLKLNGGTRSTLLRTIASLKRFYHWALVNQLIEKSPFDNFDFNRPLLSRDQIKRREEARFASPTEREIAHLRALNHLGEHLNQCVDFVRCWPKLSKHWLEQWGSRRLGVPLDRNRFIHHD